MAADAKTIWDVADTALTIGGTLIAAALGAWFTERQANRRLAKEREFKLEDEASLAARSQAKLDGQRASARMILAFHLERYAEACAHVISDNNEPDLEQATGLAAFEPWPTIDWELLGAKETARIRDIEVRVRMRESFVRGDVDQAAFNADDAAEFYSVGAAKLGLDAWSAASDLRREAGVSPLEFPSDGEGWNFVETLERELARHQAERASWKSPDL
ncbi:hypothetical protein [Brevundimonas sp. A19_0]|uniref:hypothetical protein n=1 Tax=Brevundimonas sp. A19_0 TaxID=2821087 RepID=UPI001AD96D31|nr:hypothetical protein [Brevundimonas sp. A19_0]MBO9502916.1 hypothetical protein [Brevundimonas sp. A19_0]